MLRILFVLLATAVAGVTQDTARMDKVAKSQAAGDRFMGSVLVAKDGAIVFEHSYGWANLEWKVPNTASTKFRLGSVTKQFTAAAILLLEERGKLKLDDPVVKFIPEAPSAWGKVTLYHLLTHTSGIPDFSDFPDYATLKLSPIDPARALERLRDLPLGFTPAPYCLPLFEQRRQTGYYGFRGSMARPHLPLSTLQKRPYGRLCMTRGWNDRC
jgi:CubicO group peptidase (beta-lactamase class C family)